MLEVRALRSGQSLEQRRELEEKKGALGSCTAHFGRGSHVLRLEADHEVHVGEATPSEPACAMSAEIDAEPPGHRSCGR